MGYIIFIMGIPYYQAKNIIVMIKAVKLLKCFNKINVH